MKRHRFRVADLSPDVLEVAGKEGHHAITVLRIKRGDSIELFDGWGGEAIAQVESILGGGLIARVIKRREIAVRLCGLVLASAIPKGDRADWMIEKCAELGVARLIPLICERGQVVPGEGKLDRWRRKVEAAAKQSGQTLMMEIDEPTGIEALLKVGPEMQKLYGDPSASKSIAEWLTSSASDHGWMFLVGPEGGFTELERKQMEDSTAEGVRLGSGILRIETAAVAVAAVANMFAGRSR